MTTLRHDREAVIDAIQLAILDLASALGDARSHVETAATAAARD